MSIETFHEILNEAEERGILFSPTEKEILKFFYIENLSANEIIQKLPTPLKPHQIYAVTSRFRKAKADNPNYVGEYIEDEAHGNNCVRRKAMRNRLSVSQIENYAQEFKIPEEHRKILLDYYCHYLPIDEITAKYGINKNKLGYIKTLAYNNRNHRNYKTTASSRSSLFLTPEKLDNYFEQLNIKVQQQQILYQYYIDMKSVPDIAQEFGVKPISVYKAVERFLKRIKKNIPEDISFLDKTGYGITGKERRLKRANLTEEVLEKIFSQSPYSERDKDIIRIYYLKRLPLEEIAQMKSVSTSTVTRIGLRVMKEITLGQVKI